MHSMFSSSLDDQLIFLIMININQLQDDHQNNFDINHHD